MAEDIWGERPEFPKWRTPYSTTFNHYNEILEWKKKEDAWLEKIRETYKGETPAEYFLPTDILPEPLGQDVIDALGGLDCMGCYENEIEESHDNLIAWKKLESIKTWLIEAKAQGRISMSVGFSLDQILEVEG